MGTDLLSFFFFIRTDWGPPHIMPVIVTRATHDEDSK